MSLTPSRCGDWSRHDQAANHASRPRPRRGAAVSDRESLSAAERLEGIASLACDLLAALQPWGLQPPEVRSAATRLTVALAALPLPDKEVSR